MAATAQRTSSGQVRYPSKVPQAPLRLLRCSVRLALARDLLISGLTVLGLKAVTYELR